VGGVPQAGILRRLGGPDWGEIGTINRGIPKLFEELIERLEFELSRGSDLNAERLTIGGEINDQARFRSSRFYALRCSATGEIEVGCEDLSLAVGHF
jgi:hypothetical protein